MLTIVEDTCGVHDFLLTPCSPKMCSSTTSRRTTTTRAA